MVDPWVFPHVYTCLLGDPPPGLAPGRLVATVRPYGGSAYVGIIYGGARNLQRRSLHNPYAGVDGTGRHVSVLTITLS